MILLVVNNPANWPLQLRTRRGGKDGVRLVTARAYLTEPEYSELRGVKVFNLCRSYRYQTLGYYVSLLAEARGHRPLPDIRTIQDLKSSTMQRMADDELEELIQRALAPIVSDRFTLSIFFGQNMAKRYARLARHLFNLFPAPLLRAQFRFEHEKWNLEGIDPIPASDIPEHLRAFAVEAADRYFAGRFQSGRRTAENTGYDLAILYSGDTGDQPSNERAIRKFMKAARYVGLRPEVITPDDYGRVAEFDALFIRDTTAVNHHTYRFSRRADAEGLVVIDDPLSILRCTNKVYMHELFERHHVRAPKTLIVHRENMDEVQRVVGLPCVLKRPDSSFSQGVVKAHTPSKLEEELEQILAGSELVIAQEFLRSDFDWRIGVLGGRAIYACQYHMAKGDWKIIGAGAKGGRTFGRVETLPVEFAPRRVVQLAVKAARLIGDGLYGVDLKLVGGAPYVIEVNDNPSIDAGFEDRVLGDDLYYLVMKHFLDRIKAAKEKPRARSWQSA